MSKIHGTCPVCQQPISAFSGLTAAPCEAIVLSPQAHSVRFYGAVTLRPCGHSFEGITVSASGHVEAPAPLRHRSVMPHPLPFPARVERERLERELATLPLPAGPGPYLVTWDAGPHDVILSYFSTLAAAQRWVEIQHLVDDYLPELYAVWERKENHPGPP